MHYITPPPYRRRRRALTGRGWLMLGLLATWLVFFLLVVAARL